MAVDCPLAEELRRLVQSLTPHLRPSPVLLDRPVVEVDITRHGSIPAPGHWNPAGHRLVSERAYSSQAGRRPFASNVARRPASSSGVKGRNDESPRVRRNSGSPWTRSEMNFSWTSVRVRILLVGVLGSVPQMRRNRGCHFGPRSAWPSSQDGEASGVEVGALTKDEGHHDLVARVGVGDAVDRRQQHIGVTADDGLDRGGRKVLAVDPQPVRRPAGEVHPAVPVDVCRDRHSSTTRCVSWRAWLPRCGSTPRRDRRPGC